jgi:hypothetical protein
MIQPTDRESQELKWQASYRELNRLYSLSPLAREQCGARIEQPEAEQDAIEWEVGREDVPTGLRKWSGTP